MDHRHQDTKTKEADPVIEFNCISRMGDTDNNLLDLIVTRPKVDDGKYVK